MSDVKKLLDQEAEHAEQNRDATPSSDATISRPGRERAKVLSVRLNSDEYDRLVAQAELAGVGPSTLARSLILRELSDTGESSSALESVIRRLDAIEARLTAS